MSQHTDRHTDHGAVQTASVEVSEVSTILKLPVHEAVMTLLPTAETAKNHCSVLKIDVVSLRLFCELAFSTVRKMKIMHIKVIT